MSAVSRLREWIERLIREPRPDSRDDLLDEVRRRQREIEARVEALQILADVPRRE